MVCALGATTRPSLICEPTPGGFPADCDDTSFADVSVSSNLGIAEVQGVMRSRDGWFYGESALHLGTTAGRLQRMLKISSRCVHRCKRQQKERSRGRLLKTAENHKGTPARRTLGEVRRTYALGRHVCLKPIRGSLMPGSSVGKHKVKACRLMRQLVRAGQFPALQGRRKSFNAASGANLATMQQPRKLGSTVIRVAAARHAARERDSLQK